MNDKDLARLTYEQIRTLLLQDENPFGDLTPERIKELAVLGIPNVLVYLTTEEWIERALRQVDPHIAQEIMGELDQINWNELKDIYGTAGQIPVLLRALLADDYLSANVVWDTLTNNLFHQGSVESATVAALPYFFRLLSRPEEWYQFMSLSFLCALARVAQESVDTTSDEPESHWKTIWAELITMLPTVRQLIDSPLADIHEVATLLYAYLTGTADD